jgi:hypothetical protein
VIVVETKLFVLLEVARIKSTAAHLLQSQFIETFKSFTLTPELLIQSQRKSRLASILINRIGGTPPCGIKIAATRYPFADPLGITQNVRTALEWQENTLLALFQAHCGRRGEDNMTSPLAPLILQVVTLLDNIREILGEGKSGSADQYFISRREITN